MTGPTVLSAHAVDNLGEEGVVADAAVACDLQCRHAALITGVLAIGPTAVEALQPSSLSLIAQQFDALLAQLRPAAVRTGILTGPQQVELVGELIGEAGIPNVVVAPVLRVRGTPVMDEPTRDACRRHLFPRARVVVLRAVDAPSWSGLAADDPESMKRAAARIRELGARAVLITGAIARGRVVDWLDDRGRVGVLDAARIAAPRIPGLSGAHASALAATLARGRELPAAVEAAQRYVALRLQRGS